MPQSLSARLTSPKFQILLNRLFLEHKFGFLKGRFESKEVPEWFHLFDVPQASDAVSDATSGSVTANRLAD